MSDNGSYPGELTADQVDYLRELAGEHRRLPSTGIWWRGPDNIPPDGEAVLALFPDGIYEVVYRGWMTRSGQRVSAPYCWMYIPK